MDKQELPNKSNVIRNKRGKKTIKIENDQGNNNTEKELHFELELLSSDDRNDKNRQDHQEGNQIKETHFDMNNLKNHVPKWGANITYKNQKVYLFNTCTIDNFLFAFWILYIKNKNFLNLQMNQTSRTLIRIVKYIDELNWDKAREIWVNDIMKYNEVPINYTISLFGSDRERFYSYLHSFQEHSVTQLCSPNCEDYNKIIYQDSVEISFQKINRKVELFSGISGICSKCKTLLSSRIRFKSKSSFIFVQSAYERIFIHEIPKLLKIDGLQYRFLCSTIYKPGHFVSIFDFNDQFFIVDDLDQSVSLLPPFEPNKSESNETTNYYYKTANTVSSLYYLELN